MVAFDSMILQAEETVIIVLQNLGTDLQKILSRELLAYCITEGQLQTT
jgi:hypothetical protein